MDDDKYLRLRADFENFRKRTARDHEAVKQQACSALLLDLLPVADHLELGLQAAVREGSPDALLAGLRNIQRQLDQVLERAGVTVIDTTQDYDPALHECIAHTSPDNLRRITQEVRRGYRLGDRVLRASQVIL